MSQSTAGGVSNTNIVRSVVGVLYAPFAVRVAAALAAAHAAGLDVYVFESYRSPARQAELYAQGRTKGHVVTRADAWQSWHQYGLAVDLAFGGDGRWNWNGDFAAAGAFFVAAGLAPAATFETGHWELPPVMTVARARQLAAGGGIAAVWSALDGLLPMPTRN